MHAYIAFLIYVKNKLPSECTGIEKWVKNCLGNGNIYFFPINKCLSINEGAALEWNILNKSLYLNKLTLLYYNLGF